MCYSYGHAQFIAGTFRWEEFYNTLSTYHGLRKNGGSVRKYTQKAQFTRPDNSHSIQIQHCTRMVQIIKINKYKTKSNKSVQCGFYNLPIHHEQHKMDNRFPSVPEGKSTTTQHHSFDERQTNHYKVNTERTSLGQPFLLNGRISTEDSVILKHEMSTS